MDEELKEPAPGPLVLVEAFVNTTAILYGREELREPQQLRDWLLRHTMLDAATAVDAPDLQQALAVREALRTLLRGNNGSPVPADAVTLLNRVMAEAGLTARLASASEACIVPAAGGVSGALGQILAAMVRAMADSSWSQLKACRNDACRWAFYDRSRNHSGTWCVMAVCGNRSKTKQYRRQHRHANTAVSA